MRPWSGFSFFLFNADGVCGHVPPCLPPRMVRAVPTVLCCANAVSRYSLWSTVFTLCCVHAVLNMSVLYVCVCVCVGPEVVAGKGRRPVETQNGGMVMYGNSW